MSAQANEKILVFSVHGCPEGSLQGSSCLLVVGISLRGVQSILELGLQSLPLYSLSPTSFVIVKPG